MDRKELLRRSIDEISGLRRHNGEMSGQLRIVEAFCRLIIPERGGEMHPDVLFELHQELAKLEKPATD
jgi:hypothetical protein